MDYQRMTVAELLDLAKERHWLHVLLTPEVELHEALVTYLRAIEPLYERELQKAAALVQREEAMCD